MSSIRRAPALGRKFASLKKDHATLQTRYRKLERTIAKIRQGQGRVIQTMAENIRLKNLQLDVLSCMRKISSGSVPFQIIESHLSDKLPRSDLAKLYRATFSTSRRLQKRALAMLFHLYRINPRLIAQFLFIAPSTPKRYFRQFEHHGVDRLLWPARKKVKKVEDPHYKEALLSILHSPPADFGVNRTTWTTELLSTVMKSKGLMTGHNTVSQIIRRAGYRFRKAIYIDPPYNLHAARTRVLPVANAGVGRCCEGADRRTARGTADGPESLMVRARIEGGNHLR